MLERLAHLIVRRRRVVIGVWVVLTVFGAFSASQVSKRWYQSFSIPGYSGYETDQRTLHIFGSGENPPLVLVFHSKSGQVTKETGIARAIAAAAKIYPTGRVSSYFSTGSDAYVSHDGHTTFAELYPPGNPNFSSTIKVAEIQTRMQAASPPGVQASLTGVTPLETASSGGGKGPGVLTEGLIGGAGALVILFFVFGTLPAVLMPIAVAIAAILNTFTVVWALTYLTNVSIIVEFLIALVGLGVAIDYALLMIFRFRDELREGNEVEDALVATMTHAGRSVIVSGSTVAVGLLSLILLPLPFIRSIGIGGMLIPAVSVLAAITLLPALLATLGTRINSVRLLPRRFLDKGHPEEGYWGRWAELVMRRPWLIGGIGAVVVGLLVYSGLQLNPAEAQVKDIPGSGSAIVGRTVLADAGITPGVMKPFEILVDGGPTAPVLAKLRATPGITAAIAPAAWHKGAYRLIEAFPSSDGDSSQVQGAISEVRAELAGSDAALGGVPAEDKDFVDAVYSNFPYVLGFVVLLTFVLLTRAFRSLVLPLKAAVLNLISLAAAYGIIVFIFQQGHGSQAIWNVAATQSIIPWIPLMIFAFLFGLSMDYEVFMLTRMREVYDDTGDTRQAVSLGLARTGKLVTSAALILMFAFFVLSSSPGLDIKQFGIGLAAGIIFDATVIRALLVPAIMRIIGPWNWWLPQPVARMLFLPRPPLPEPSLEPS